MRFPSKETVERIRKEYPVGTRVELVRMEDPQAPPVGTKGTVKTPYFRMLVFSLRYIAPLAIGLVFLDQLGAFSFLK